MAFEIFDLFLAESSLWWFLILECCSPYGSCRSETFWVWVILHDERLVTRPPKRT
jgi:hypothetical protein